MRRLVIILVSVAVLILIVLLVLPALVNANRFRPRIEAELTQSLGRRTTIGDLTFNVFSGTVTAKDVTIADDPAFSRMPFIVAKSTAFSIDVLPALLEHRINIQGATIDSPEITLIQAPSGKWNFSSMTAGARSQKQSAPQDLQLSIQSLKIRNARLILREGQQPQVLEKVNANVDGFAPGANFPYSLTGQMQGGGTIVLDGKAGPIDANNAADTPLTANVRISNLNLTASGIVPRSAGIDGLVGVNASGNSVKGVLHLAGNVEAQRIKLAPHGTPAHNPLTFAVDLTDDLNHHTGQMTRGDVAIGGVKATLSGSWAEQQDNTIVRMNLTGAGVPVSGIIDLLPALDIHLPSGSSLEGGTASANLAITGPASSLVVSGPVGVRDTRLKGFNIGAQLAPIARLAGINAGGPNTEIQTLSANIRATQQETVLQDIRVVVPAIGEMTGAGTVSASQAINFRMTAAVRASGLIASNASARIPFTITGTSSNPRFQPDVGQIAAQEINRQLKGVNVGGVNVGQAAGGILGGLLGGKGKK